MQSKLQELTEKIYKEGVDKANKEAEDIVNQAKKEAEKIVQDAKKEAEQTVDQAQKDADELKKKVQAEVKQASFQTLRTVEQNITNLISSKVVDEPVKKSFKEQEFMKKLIEEVIKNWNASNPQSDLSLILPEKDQQELVDYLKSSAKKLMDGGLDVTVDSKIKAGFKIGPADGSYQVSFKEEDFENLIKYYLRPKTVEFLYGKK